MPSEQITAVPAGTTTVVDGGGGLLLLMQADSVNGSNRVIIKVRMSVPRQCLALSGPGALSSLAASAIRGWSPYGGGFERPGRDTGRQRKDPHQARLFNDRLQRSGGFDRHCGDPRASQQLTFRAPTKEEN